MDTVPLLRSPVASANTNPIRPAFAAASAPTLATVRAAVASISDLAPPQRRDLLSALDSFARAAGTDLARLPAHSGALGQRMKTIRPAAADIKPRRWQNIISLVRSALELAGQPVLPGRYQVPFSPAWKALQKALPDKGLREKLSRLGHYCSAASIEPDQVDDVVLAEFHRALVEEAVITHPEKTFKVAVTAWNHAVTLLPEFGLAAVTPVTLSRDYVRPWSEFPPTLEAEVTAYLDWASQIRLSPTAPTRRRRPGQRAPKPLRPRTRQNQDWQLRQAATALVEAGWAPTELTGLASLVDPAAVEAVGDFLITRSANNSKAAASLTCGLLRTIARDWLRMPEDQRFAELDTICANATYAQTGLTEKNADRLRPFNDPANIVRLLRLPGDLVAEAKAGDPDERAARLVQTALAIELAIVAPMRPGNLAALDLDQHLRRSRNAKGAAVHFVIPARSVKNNVPLDYPLPADTIALLDLYQAGYRSQLIRKPTSALFPGDKGGAKCLRALSDQVVGTIRDRLGLDLNLHLFRHLAAKIYLDRHPGAYEVVRRVLGHQSMQTTINYYAGLETAAAVRHYDETVLHLRSGPGGRR